MTQLALKDLLDDPVLEKNPFKREVPNELPQKEQAKEPAPQERPLPKQEESKPEAEIEDAEETEDETEEEEKPRVFRKGRPRSQKSRAAILKATNALLLHTSVQELSIEAIARRAKVGKTTIYRWWPNKTAVVMEALASQPGMQSPLPTARNNSEAIVMQLEKLIRLLHSKNGETIAQLFSEAQGNDESLKIFENNFLGPLMDAIEYSIEQGKLNKEFRASLDIKLAMDILCGPIFFRLLAHPGDFDADFEHDFPRQIVRVIAI